jgi:hypothetical protein
MGTKKQLEFFLLRYVPDAVTQYFVNIGFVIFEPGVNGGFADVRFTKDWREVKRLDPDADIELLQAMENDIRTQLPILTDRETLLKRLQDSFSASVQISPVAGCQTAEPTLELSVLSKIYLDSRDSNHKTVASGRQGIVGRMRNSFEQEGVLHLMVQGFAVEKYTRPGDPLKIDFGYTAGERFNMLHAVSLKASVEHAVTLAYRFPKIREGVLKSEFATARLTAVVDDGLDLGQQEVAFALGVLEENRVQIATVSEMPRIAEIARMELKA